MTLYALRCNTCGATATATDVADQGAEIDGPDDPTTDWTGGSIPGCDHEDFDIIGSHEEDFPP